MAAALVMSKRYNYKYKFFHENHPVDDVYERIGNRHDLSVCECVKKNGIGTWRSPNPIVSMGCELQDKSAALGVNTREWEQRADLGRT